MNKLAESIIAKAIPSLNHSVTTDQLKLAVEAITAFNDGSMVFINNNELHSITEDSLTFNCTNSIIPICYLKSVTTVR